MYYVSVCVCSSDVCSMCFDYMPLYICLCMCAVCVCWECVCLRQKERGKEREKENVCCVLTMCVPGNWETESTWFTYVKEWTVPWGDQIIICPSMQEYIFYTGNRSIYCHKVFSSGVNRTKRGLQGKLGLWTSLLFTSRSSLSRLSCSLFSSPSISPSKLGLRPRAGGCDHDPWSAVNHVI